MTGVRALDRAGRAVELPASITVGADGIRSTVAAARAGARPAAGPVLLGGPLPLPRRWLAGRRVRVGLRRRRGRRADPHQRRADLRVRQHHAATDAGAAPHRRRAGLHHAARPEPLRPGRPRRRCARRPVAIHGWGGAPGYVRQSWGPGWALVGDAGYFKDPITTHGMTDALRDAELLAARDHRDDDRRAAQRRSRYARYQATRDRLSSRAVRRDRGRRGLQLDLDRVQTLLRRVSAAMSDEVGHLHTLPDPRVRAQGQPPCMSATPP